MNGTLKSQFVCKNTGGEGVFQLYLHGQVPEVFQFNDLPPPEFQIDESVFSITPTSFALGTGEEITLDITFKPVQVTFIPVYSIISVIPDKFQIEISQISIGIL